MALIELHGSNFARALHFAQLALEEYDRHGRPDRPRLIWYHHTLALTREANGDLNGARQAFEGAFAILQEMGAMRSPKRISFLEDYAKLLRKTGQKHKAHEIQKQATQECSDLMKDNSFQYSVDANALLR